ncbi:MAG TPA: DMT family transporter [Brevefilum fermentans]|jgi:drug/metabolite transporter (DMT)-like permease|nr:DMT family transporter [Brevefilum fermentans]HQA28637.1 DMT family transporter [Brevefilum fermentans]
MSSAPIALQLYLMQTSDLRFKQYQPVLATTSGIFFVSTASIFIRFAQQEASSIVIAATRMVIASLVLIPVAWIRYRQEWQSLSRAELFKGSLAGLFLALHFAAWISSLELTSIASSVVLVTTTPLWVALLSPFILKEPIRRSVLLGLLISIAGGVVVGLGHACQLIQGEFVCQVQTFDRQNLLGNFLALFGAWMAAGYMIIGRQLRKKLNTISYTALVYGVSALLLVILALIEAEPVLSYSGITYVWLIALGVFPQLLGHSLLNWALKHISATYVALTLLGEPIGTIILAMIFLKERPTLLEAVGSVLIMVGIVIGSIRRVKRINGVEPAP